MKARLTTVVLTATLALGGLAAGAVVVPAMAATDEPAATSTGSTTSESGSGQAPPGGRVALIRDALADLVAAGTIDDAQADAVAESLAEQLPGRGPGGPDGPDGHGPWGHGGGPGLGVALDTAATTLGITAEELRTALFEGRSLADLAEEQGIETDALVAALVGAGQARLAELVEAGELSQAQADRYVSGLTELVTEVVEGDGAPFGGVRGGPPFGGEPGEGRERPGTDLSGAGPSALSTS